MKKMELIAELNKITEFGDNPDILIECAHNDHDFDLVIGNNGIILKTNSKFNERL